MCFIPFHPQSDSGRAQDTTSHSYVEIDDGDFNSQEHQRTLGDSDKEVGTVPHCEDIPADSAGGTETGYSSHDKKIAEGVM